MKKLIPALFVLAVFVYTIKGGTAPVYWNPSQGMSPSSYDVRVVNRQTGTVMATYSTKDVHMDVPINWVGRYAIWIRAVYLSTGPKATTSTWCKSTDAGCAVVGNVSEGWIVRRAK